MLELYELYKNQRGRFISLEKQKSEKYYNAYMISKSGRYSFITNVSLDNKDDFISKFELQLASESEHTKIALCRINPDFELM